MTKFKARPTVYKGIQMRSRLEAGFAAWLDECGLYWEYEGSAYASEKGQYLPDFLVVGISFLGFRDPIHFEVKPDSYLAKASETYPDGQMAIDEFEVQHQILKASVPNALLFLATPSGIYWSDGHLFPACFVSVGPARPVELAILLPPPWAGEYWKPIA